VRSAFRVLNDHELRMNAARSRPSVSLAAAGWRGVDPF